MAEALLEAQDIRKEFTSGGGERLEVLRGTSLQVQRGEMVAIVGESGTGKTTLLHLLGALDRPTSGKVYYSGEDIFSKSDEELATFRNKSIGFVFQFHHLLPEFTALENVAMPALIQNRAVDDVRGRAQELLEMLGVGQRASHRPNELSGGERQRVAVARALMNEPGLVLADEPSGNLDTKTAEELHQNLFHLQETLGQAFILATHNLSLAIQADRVLRLSEGQLEAEDKDVLRQSLVL